MNRAVAGLRCIVRRWRSRVGSAETSTLVVTMPALIGIILGGLQLGLIIVAKLEIDAAASAGAQAAAFAGGEDATVDLAVATALSPLDSANGEGTVSWGVYSASDCSGPVAAGSASWGAPLYFCLSYSYPYNVIFTISGVADWKEVKYVRAQVGT